MGIVSFSYSCQVCSHVAHIDERSVLLVIPTVMLSIMMSKCILVSSVTLSDDEHSVLSHVVYLPPRLEESHQALITMWHTMHIDLKCMLSYQYLLRDIQLIQSWTLITVSPNSTFFLFSLSG